MKRIIFSTGVLTNVLNIDRYTETLVDYSQKVPKNINSQTNLTCWSIPEELKSPYTIDFNLCIYQCHKDTILPKQRGLNNTLERGRSIWKFIDPRSMLYQHMSASAYQVLSKGMDLISTPYLPVFDTNRQLICEAQP